MKIKFAKLDAMAILPTYSRQGDAGLDLTAISYRFVEDGELSYHNYEFGLSLEIPEGYVGLIFPRSSISNKNLMLTNCVGVIDSNYRGPLSARFKTIKGNNELYVDRYTPGDRVAQLVILPCPQVTIEESSPNSLSVTERGNGGWGSSGR